MSKNVIIVNTHPTENTEFVGRLVNFLNAVEIAPIIFEPYEKGNPLNLDPYRIILTGVPIDADYSLADTETQKVIEEVFTWLRKCPCPVLGICYGHQILAYIFGGEVSPLGWIVRNEELTLAWKRDLQSGIFSEVERLTVFAEHRDFVSKIPEDFSVLCQVEGIPYIMYHPARAMYGIQFVPEQSDALSKQVLQRFVGKSSFYHLTPTAEKQAGA
jgi:GMP synthase-like glutamine amidotransferase